MINVKLKTRENIDVQLQPKQGIKIDSSNKYLFDPTLMQGYVDLTKDYSDKAMQSEANAKASEMNAELSAEQAKASEDNAKLSENRAIEAETKAKTSEVNAKASENKAIQEANASAESAYQSQQSALASYQYASNAEEDAKNSLETLGHILESEERTREYSEIAQEKADEASQFTLECQDIKNSLGTVYTFKGSVATVSALPTNAKVGDVYDVQDSGNNYAWTGSSWDSLGVNVDLSNYVDINSEQTISGKKKFTQPLTIQNGEGTGSLWIGGNVNSGNLSNKNRHIARISVPSYNDITKATTMLGFDSSGDNTLSVANNNYDTLSFGGQKKITNATSPMAIGFCVTKTRESTGATDKVIPLEMDANEVRFNAQPNYKGNNLVTDIELQDAVANAGDVSYEDLDEEVTINPTPIREEWQTFQNTINNIINSLETELNKVKSVRYVVEKGQDGNRWYTLYSDGWCEQGGKASAVGEVVTFLKPFKDTNYNAQVTPSYVGTQTVFNWAITPKTTSTMKIDSSDNTGTTNRPCDWLACGYIK
jgi:chemotaxis protein histidine kinase CheA